MKKISIVCAVYNTEEFLKECLNSIIKQTMNKKDYEVIIVDDGSKDSSARILREYIKDNKDWTLITQNNKGAAAARNEALKKATGEFIAILDSDDLFENNALEVMYSETTKNNAEIGLFRTSRFNSEKVQGDLYEEVFIKVPNETTLEESPILCKTIRNAAILYNHKLIDDIFFIEGGIHEDIYFYLKSLSIAKKIYISDKKVYKIRIREGENNSVMQSLNYNTFQYCITNITKADLEIKNSKIVKYNSNALFAYIVLNINDKKEKKVAKKQFVGYLNLMFNKKIINITDYLYIIVKIFIKILLNKF